LHSREAGLGQSILLSHIREAISSATGEQDHHLHAPLADVPASINQLLVYGGCEWLP